MKDCKALNLLMAWDAIVKGSNWGQMQLESLDVKKNSM